MNTHRLLIFGIRAAWIVAMLAVLIAWVVAVLPASWISSQPVGGGEQHILAIVALIALTFPIGLAFAVALNAAAYLLHAAGIGGPDLGHVSTMLLWLGFVVLGYVQWFRLLPWLRSRWQKARDRRVDD